MFLGIIGACVKAPPLKEITWASEMKTRCAVVALLTWFAYVRVSQCAFRTIDDMDARMGFANFVTRGNVLGQDEKSDALVTSSS